MKFQNIFGRLFGLPFIMILFAQSTNAQENHWIFSVQKDILWPNQTIAGHIKHDRKLKNSYYTTFGVGVYAFERWTFNKFDNQRITHIVPERDFEFKDQFDLTDGRVGTRQARGSQDLFEMDISVFYGVGKNWLNNSEKWSLFTDIGFGLTYQYTKLYGASFTHTLPDLNSDPNIRFQSHFLAIERTLWITAHFNLDLTYYLNSKIGVGVNSYLKTYFLNDISFAGLIAPTGIHIRYSY